MKVSQRGLISQISYSRAAGWLCKIKISDPSEVSPRTWTTQLVLTIFQDGQTYGSGGIQEDLRSLNVEGLKICAWSFEFLFFGFSRVTMSSRIFSLFEPLDKFHRILIQEYIDSWWWGWWLGFILIFLATGFHSFFSFFECPRLYTGITTNFRARYLAS